MDYLMLEVDLTERTSRIEKIPNELAEAVVGGRGLAAQLLLEQLAPEIDAYTPENPLLFVSGPLQGTRAFFSSKSVAATRSPQTGLYLYSVASGSFCGELHRCGYAVLRIRGQASEPTYLVLKDFEVEFRDATKIWGLCTSDAQEEMLRSLGGKKFSTAVIGPAGENLVRYAAIITEGNQRQAFGRGGAGAVMGSKNLKGVAIKGSNEVPVADLIAFEKAQKHVLHLLSTQKQLPYVRRLYGTAADIETLAAVGLLPVRNWQSGEFPNLKKIAPTHNREQYTIRDLACGRYCPAPCNHTNAARNLPYAGTTSHGPEYETIYSFGN